LAEDPPAGFYSPAGHAGDGRDEKLALALRPASDHALRSGKRESVVKKLITKTKGVDLG